MSKQDEARGLLALALDAGKPAAERLAALQAANDLRSGLKVGWGKLGAPDGFNMAAALMELDEQAQQAKGDAEKPQEPTEPSAEGPAKKPKKEKKPTDPNRGAIGRQVNLLLTTTDLDYASIVAAVKADHPEAKTTARSVASVAADLRRDGVQVATRRKPKREAPAAGA